MIMKKSYKYRVSNGEGIGLLPEGAICYVKVLAKNDDEQYLVYFPAKLYYLDDDKRRSEKACPSISVANMGMDGILHRGEDYFNVFGEGCLELEMGLNYRSARHRM